MEKFTLIPSTVNRTHDLQGSHHASLTVSASGHATQNVLEGYKLTNIK